MEEVKQVEEKPSVARYVFTMLGRRISEQFLSILLLLFSNIIPSVVIHYGVVLLQTHLNFKYDASFFDVWIGISVIELLIKTIF